MLAVKTPVMLQPPIAVDKKKAKFSWRAKLRRANATSKDDKFSPTSFPTSVSPAHSLESFNGVRGSGRRSISPNSDLAPLLRSGGSCDTTYSDPDSIFSGTAHRSPPIFQRSKSLGNQGPSNDLLKASNALQEVMSSPRRKGPKVKPFIFTQTQQNKPRTNNINDLKCFICDEMLYTKLEHEKLVDLKCGDVIHGECFNITVNFEIEKLLKLNIIDTNDSPLTQLCKCLPHCQGLNCKTNNISQTMTPFDSSIVDKLFANALLDHKKSKFVQEGPNLSSLSSTLRYTKSLEGSICQSDILSPTFNKKEQSAKNQTGGNLRVSGTVLRSDSKKRGGVNSLISWRSTSSYLRLSRSPSPTASMSTTNTVTVRISKYKEVPLDILKSAFIQYLIDNCSGLQLTSLLKFGELRLIDELLVGYDGLSYSTKIVYLFENYLVVWNMGSNDCRMFPMIDTFVQTPDVSTLMISDRKLSHSQIWLNSETDSIIEKWVVATSDFNFKFPSEILTSTIILPTLSNGFERPLTRPLSAIKNNNKRLSDITEKNAFVDESASYLALNSTSSIFLPDSVTMTHKEASPNEELSIDKQRVDGIFKHETILSDNNGNCGISRVMLIQDGSLSSESDLDSDQEVINEFMQKCNVKSEKTWDDLISKIDNVLFSSAS
ncbi:uncharacterized protein PRCAT00000786001 [Priceomyces carsonii]|uniref:uncharacterized protein n=1 Tax=Priceomyces carsonii TaxID=28549 RepID=UPI002EDAFB8D|nr:unnamed protein product [Priceomyces carsonii]